MLLREAPLLSDLFVHLPASALPSRLPAFLDLGWQPEIALQTRDLDTLDCGAAQDLGRQLQRAGLRCCLHAPFLDLNPASEDLDIRSLARRRFEQTLDFAAAVGAGHIVFHPGYDPWRYARSPRAWLENSLIFWLPLVDRAHSLDLTLCLENIFEKTPDQLAELLRSLDSPHLRHCFDIGHWHLFSRTSLAQWFEQLGPFLSHLHLHDNRGRGDDHRPIGKGKIDFEAFFTAIDNLGVQPTATLEAHNHKDALASLKALDALLVR